MIDYTLAMGLLLVGIDQESTYMCFFHGIPQIWIKEKEEVGDCAFPPSFFGVMDYDTSHAGEWLYPLLNFPPQNDWSKPRKAIGFT